MRRESKNGDDLLFSERSSIKVNPKLIMKKIGIESGILFFVFLLTYMLYPSIVYVKSGDVVPGRQDWSIFIINITLGLSDFTGRSLAKFRESYSR